MGSIAFNFGGKFHVKIEFILPEMPIAPSTSVLNFYAGLGLVKWPLERDAAFYIVMSCQILTEKNETVSQKLLRCCFVPCFANYVCQSIPQQSALYILLF